MTPTDAEIIAAGPWFQQVEFPSGRIVGSWDTLAMYANLCAGVDLAAKTVMDLGCMAGVGTMWLEKQGAAVFPKDVTDLSERQFGIVKKAFGLDAVYERRSIYDLSDADRCDVTVMGGLYYHLEHPLLGLKTAWDLTNEVLCVEGETIEGDDTTALFVPGEYKGDGSNWWVPTPSCLRAWLEWLPGQKTVTEVTPDSAYPGRKMFQVRREM